MLPSSLNLMAVSTGLLSRQQSQPTTEHSASLPNTETPYGSPPSHTTPTYSGNDYLVDTADQLLAESELIFLSLLVMPIGEIDVFLEN